MSIDQQLHPLMRALGLSLVVTAVLFVEHCGKTRGDDSSGREKSVLGGRQNAGTEPPSSKPPKASYADSESYRFCDSIGIEYDGVYCRGSLTALMHRARDYQNQIQGRGEDTPGHAEIPLQIELIVTDMQKATGHRWIMRHLAMQLDATVLRYVGRQRIDPEGKQTKRTPDKDTGGGCKRRLEVAWQCCPCGLALLSLRKNPSDVAPKAWESWALVEQAVQIALRSTHVLYAAPARESSPVYRALVNGGLRCSCCRSFTEGKPFDALRDANQAKQ